jgi:hypothetical protein
MYPTTKVELISLGLHHVIKRDNITISHGASSKMDENEIGKQVKLDIINKKIFLFSIFFNEGMGRCPMGNTIHVALFR